MSFFKDPKFIEDLEDITKFEVNVKKLNEEIVSIDKKLQEIDREALDLFYKADELRVKAQNETNDSNKSVLIRQLAAITHRAEIDMETESNFIKRRIKDVKKIRKILYQEGKVEKHAIHQLAA